MTNSPRDAVVAEANSARDTVFASAFTAAVGAGFAGTAPTGTTWWDPILTGLLAVVFVVAATRAKTAVVIAAAIVSAMFVGLSFWLPVAAAGFVAALVALRKPNRQISMHAISACLSFLCLLHLNSLGFFGSSALLAGAVIVAVLGSGYLGAQPAAQSQWRKATTLVVATAVLVVGIAGVVGLSARGAADSGVNAARAGLEAARFGDPQQVAAQLDVAESELRQASRRVSSPLMKPALLVPVAAQHVRAASTALSQGSIIAESAATAVRDANVNELRFRQGEFDLNALASMAEPLDTVATRLAQSVAVIRNDRSKWLLPPVDKQLGLLEDEVADVLPEAQVAAEAAAVLPAMLGSEAERRYLVLVGSPAEAREFGGFVSGYGLIAVNGGALDLLESGSVNDLIGQGKQDVLDEPLSYPVEFRNADPTTYPQNLTSTPNIQLVARAVRDVFPELAGAPIDGVIYLDPFVLAAMTEFTGPLEVRALDRSLDRDGVVEFLFDGQYRELDGRAERFSAIGELAKTTAARFQGVDLPGPERLGRILGPLARAGRLQIVSYDDRENEFLWSVQLQRVFGLPQGLDSFAVVHTNGAPSKLDLYLRRQVRYDAVKNSDGSLDIEVEVDLRSEIPADAPAITFGETDGTHQVLLSLYSPHELVGVTVDGQDHEVVPQQEFGFNRYSLFKVPIAPNQERIVRFQLSGQMMGDEYRAAVWSQPLMEPEVIAVSFTNVDGTRIQRTHTLVENWIFDPQDPG